MENIYELMQQERQKQELEKLVGVNQETQQFGLSLSPDDAKELMLARNETLKDYGRVEFGEGILDKLIFTFCDSQYINQDNYLAVAAELQDIFYAFKNETGDKVTDDELLDFMKDQYEHAALGDLEYLKEESLGRFAEAVRSGYTDYQYKGGKGQDFKADGEARWNEALYLEALKEQFWD